MEDDADYITISDDEDVCVLKHVINLEPILVDLTDSDAPLTPERDSRVLDQNQYSQYFRESEPRQQQQPRVTTPPRHTNPPRRPAPQQHPVPPHFQQQHQQRPQQPHGPQQPEQPQQSQEPFQPQQSQQPFQPQQSQQPFQPQQSQQPFQPQQPQQPFQPQHPQQPLQPQQPQQPLQPQQPQQPLQPQQPQQSQQPLKQEEPKKPLSDHELMIAKKNLGNEKYKNNLLNEAIRTYREASELARKLDDKDMSATLHFNLAMTYDRLGSYNQAADECAAAVKLKNNYMKPHLKRAEIYERLHKYDEAVICWEHICELDSTNRDYAIRLNRVREAAKRSRKKDPLELLGLNPINFTREDLRKAYKRKALTHHPDRHPDADIVTRRIQEKLFKDASEAHSHIQLRFGYNR